MSTLRLKVKQVSALTGERKKLAVREAERELEEADDILRQMANYARTAAAGGGAAAKIAAFQTDLSRVRRDFDKASQAGAQRDELFDNGGAGSDDLAVRSVSQRSALLQDRQMLEDGRDRLASTRAVSQRTEEIGAGILGNLGNQREALLRADAHLSGTDEQLSRGRRILRAMDRRVMTNKLVLVLIAVFLAACIGGVVYFKWFSGKWPVGDATTTTTLSHMMTAAANGSTTAAAASSATAAPTTK
jgi:vesicle transport through interaction with t-SNAREs protein 1